MRLRSVLLSAGEASGDRHAAAVARAIAEGVPEVALRGIGGAAMRAAGVRTVYDIGSLQAIGLVEAAATLPAHVRAYREAARVLRGGVDLVVLVDYPGFHHRLAKLAHRHGVPVLYYIAPQLWAWGAWRAGALRRTVDRLAVVLPFEEPFFRRRGIPVRFVGHPLLESARPDRAEARRRLHVGGGDCVVGLFPGSRPAERARLWPVFRDAATILRQRHPGVRVLVADAPAGPTNGAGDPASAPAEIVAAAADVALTKSGTTTLELALAGTPHVVAYRMHPLSWAVARATVRVPWVGLVNLILGRPAVPELLQDGATPAALAEAMETILSGPPAREQRAAFGEVVERLGTPGAARRVAELAIELVA